MKISSDAINVHCFGSSFDLDITSLPISSDKIDMVILDYTGKFIFHVCCSQ